MDYPKPITSIDELPKRYGGIEREQYWQQYWMACGVYDYDPTRPRDEVYSVDTPPPTVSGALHIGHVFSYTQTDFSVRYQRMAGKHVFYPFGFDDNGLPSERLVERVTGQRAHEVGREEFIKLCKPILEEAEQQFKDLWQSLALSCDWSQFYTTIEAKSRAISQASFIDLYNKGYVYRKEAPTMWCWVDQTAIAQAEIEDREVPGHFYDITFQIDDGSGKLQPVTIATTRPELIPACVAVFAHPDDERYKHLFGKKAITPLFNVEVPILPSAKADPEKGTGILMCCTFGDQDDVEHWEQEWPFPNQVPGGKLGTRVVIGEDGRILDFANRIMPTHKYDAEIAKHYSKTKELGDAAARIYAASGSTPSRTLDQASELAQQMAGMKIKRARNWIREELDKKGLLTRVEEITHTVRHSERGGVPIEIIVTPQWYIKLLEHKDKLLAQGRKVQWHPEHMRKRFEHWVEGLNQDWCISRQRYNGVPFPVWYAPGKNEMVPIFPRNENLPVNPLAKAPENILELAKETLNKKYGEGHVERMEELLGFGLTLTPEADVMDTWATSSLTPLLCTGLLIERDESGALKTTERHDKLYPMDLRPQAHDIIRTWAFYTIVKSYYHFGVIPWKHIVISGHAQDVGRKKITKSKGHTVTPAEMVEKYTADGLRYWAAGCKLGTDTLYDEKNLGDGKRLITKLFNATKFALRHLLDFDPSTVGAGLSPAQGGSETRPYANYSIDALLKLVTYPTDRWMLERLRQTIERATKAQDDYEFGDAKQAVEDFFWADFCDNYLELSKGRLYRDELATAAHPDADADELHRSAQAALFLALSAVLKLFAPVLPHICEECWSWYHAQWTAGRSIHEEPWPPCDRAVAGDAEMNAGRLLVDIVALARKWKSEGNVSLKKPVAKLTVYVPDDAAATRFDESALAMIRGDLLSTTNAAGIVIVDGAAPDGAVIIDGNPFAVSCELAEEAEI